MPKHEVKYCPRCNESFECKVGSIELCQCSQINLTAEEINFIQSLYDDCICLTCMKVLKSEYHSRKHLEKLNQISSLFTIPKKKNL